MTWARGIAISLCALLVAGCADVQSCLDAFAAMQMQDIQYLNGLNAKVKEGMITEGDRERLWQAYLVRLQSRRHRIDFVAPHF